MEQRHEFEDLYNIKNDNKRTPSKKGQVSSVGNVSSLPGMYLLGNNMEPNTQESEVLSHSDKSATSKDTPYAAQLSNLNDFDVFPPLGTQQQTIKSEKVPLVPNRHDEYLEIRKISYDECVENSGANTSQPKSKKNIETPQGKNKPEWKCFDFWNMKKEETLSLKSSNRKEIVASLHEWTKSSVQVRSSSSGGNFCLSTVQKTNLNKSFRKYVRNYEKDTSTMVLPGEVVSSYRSDSEKSHWKNMSDRNLYHSLGNKENVNKTNNASCSSDCSEKSSHFTERSSVSFSRRSIISYLKMFLEKEEQHSLASGNSPESQILPSTEFPSSDDSATEYETPCREKTCINEEKLMDEYDRVCEEMLDHYIVLSNLPYGLTRRDILYHISKVGIVTYLIMDRSKAHVIFLKAEDAEKAFGMRHELCGVKLVVHRPKRLSCTLYFSGLTINTPVEEVMRAVSKYGVILNFYRPLHKPSGGPAGYCFIKVDEKVAEKILRETSLVVNNVKIFVEVSSQSEVKMSSSQCPRSVSSAHSDYGEEYKVMFTDVPLMASYDIIKEHFQEFGRLQKVFLRNRKGFVIFASRDSLEQALSTRHTILGTELKLSRGSLVP